MHKGFQWLIWLNLLIVGDAMAQNEISKQASTYLKDQPFYTLVYDKNYNAKDGSEISFKCKEGYSYLMLFSLDNNFRISITATNKENVTVQKLSDYPIDDGQFGFTPTEDYTIKLKIDFLKEGINQIYVSIFEENYSISKDDSTRIQSLKEQASNYIYDIEDLIGFKFQNQETDFSFRTEPYHVYSFSFNSDPEYEDLKCVLTHENRHDTVLLSNSEHKVYLHKKTNELSEIKPYHFFNGKVAKNQIVGVIGVYDLGIRLDAVPRLGLALSNIPNHQTDSITGEIFFEHRIPRVIGDEILMAYQGVNNQYFVIDNKGLVNTLIWDKNNEEWTFLATDIDTKSLLTYSLLDKNFQWPKNVYSGLVYESFNGDKHSAEHYIRAYWHPEMDSNETTLYQSIKHLEKDFYALQIISYNKQAVANPFGNKVEGGVFDIKKGRWIFDPKEYKLAHKLGSYWLVQKNEELLLLDNKKRKISSLMMSELNSMTDTVQLNKMSISRSKGDGDIYFFQSGKDRLTLKFFRNAKVLVVI